MRALLVALLLALSALPALPAAAQEAAPAAVPLAEDAAGDVRLDAQATSQGAPPQISQSLDLRSLVVTEDPGSFTFTVQVADMKTGSDAAGHDGEDFTVTFTHAKRDFQLRMVHQTLEGASDQSYGYLESRDNATQPWNIVQYVDTVAVDAKAETVSATVPRDALADARGAAPFPGRFLQGFSVHSSNLLTFYADMADDMPDNGVAPGQVAIKYGIRQEGDARLSSDDPFRASNGEATTFLFKAQGLNIGDANDTYHLRVKEVPPGWSVILPQTFLEIAAGGSVEFPVVVEVPFNHAHGTTASFIVEMASGLDARSIGRIAMGVRYLAIPQPAGHHDTLWFHSRAADQVSQALGTVFQGNSGAPYMDAMETLEGDANAALPPQSENTAIVGSTPLVGYQWCVPLDPGLQMGLDFKVGGAAHLQVPVHVTLPFNGAFLRAGLYLTPPDYPSYFGCYIGSESKLLGALNETAPQDLPANSDAVLQGDMTMFRAADRIPYVKGQNLVLQVEAWGVGASTFYGGAAKPELIPGGQVTLPLLEYKDAVNQALTTGKGPALVPLGPQERLANPGATVVFPLSIANEAAVPQTVAFNVSGLRSEWVDPVADVDVPAHGVAKASITVRVPADAKDGDLANLLVQAYAQDNATNRSILRLVVAVDTTATHADDAAAAPMPSKHSPPAGPATAALLVALAGCVGSRRRGRSVPVR